LPITEPEAPARVPLRSLPLAAALTAAPALAQLDILQPPPSLPGLPDPPFLSHALFENPIPPVILSIALGLAAYAIATRLNRRRLGVLAAGVGLALGAVVVLIATLVETKRERVQAQTRSLVAAVAKADTTALDRMLAADARLFVTGFQAGWTKDQILAWIEKYLGPGSVYAVADHRTGEIQAEIGPSGRVARTRATVAITPTEGGPSRFICMVQWQETTPGQWTAIEIDPLWVQGYGVITDTTMRDTPRW
jgi:hypothetical protein